MVVLVVVVIVVVVVVVDGGGARMIFSGNEASVVGCRRTEPQGASANEVEEALGRQI